LFSPLRLPSHRHDIEDTSFIKRRTDRLPSHLAREDKQANKMAGGGTGSKFSATIFIVAGVASLTATFLSIL
jgi:hypothetical protein